MTAILVLRLVVLSPLPRGSGVSSCGTESAAEIDHGLLARKVMPRAGRGSPPRPQQQAHAGPVRTAAGRRSCPSPAGTEPSRASHTHTPPLGARAAVPAVVGRPVPGRRHVRTAPDIEVHRPARSRRPAHLPRPRARPRSPPSTSPPVPLHQHTALVHVPADSPAGSCPALTSADAPTAATTSAVGYHASPDTSRAW